MQVQRTLELAAALNQHQTNAAAAAAANQHAQLVAHMDKAVANSGSSFCDVTHQQCVGGGGGGGGGHNSHHAKLCRCVSCLAATHANGGAKVLTREEEFILKYGLLANNSGSQSNSATAVKENTYPLRVWLEENRDNPYPTKSEKLMLSIVTKMTLTQVSTWFANARRRLKKERRPEHDFLHDFYPFSLYPPLITAPQFYPPPTAAIPKILPTAAANLIGPQPAAIQPIRVLPINHQGLSPTAIHEYLLSHREALNSLGLPSSVDPGRPKVVHQEFPPQTVVNKEAERIQTVIVNKPIITETTTTTTASIPKPSVNAPTERSRFSNISPDVQVIKSANEVHRPPRENISQLHNKNVNKSPAKNIWSIVDTVKTAKTK